jgi:alkylhydroperoxidase family enzyme
MRLEPIENPKNLLVKLAFWWSKREFGKVIMPLKIIYARKPKLMLLANKIIQFQEKSISLEPELRLLIQTQVSMLNGCTFCNDISLAQAVRKKLGAEKFFALGDDFEAKSFTEKEQVVIAFVNEYAENRKVSDETFENLRSFFNETEILEIVAMNAFEQYFNAFAVPLEIESDGLKRLAENKKYP